MQSDLLDKESEELNAKKIQFDLELNLKNIISYLNTAKEK